MNDGYAGEMLRRCLLVPIPVLVLVGACAPPCPRAAVVPEITGERPDRTDGGDVTATVDDYGDTRAAFIENENHSALVAAPLPAPADANVGDVTLAQPTGEVLNLVDWRGNDSFETQGKRFLDAEAVVGDDLGALFAFVSMDLQHPELSRGRLVEAAKRDQCDVSNSFYDASDGRPAAVQWPGDDGAVTVEVGAAAVVVDRGARFLVQPTEAMLAACPADGGRVPCGMGQVLVRRLAPDPG